MMGKRLFAIIACLALLSTLAPSARGYAVLSHEAIIDSAWDTDIKLAIRKKFPGVTPDQLKEAHGYAYGGAIIQDMGYYPHGSFFFSDLTHYVRSGDFVLALLRDAQNPDEYAFALGALAHYAADNEGHRLGTNRSVPLLYPKLREKYGDSITYEEGKLEHVKTEFGFDVLQVARSRYAPDSYHDFIGFNVAQRLLDQAFQDTYGLQLKSVLSNEDTVLNSYRYDVSKLMPKATRIAWSLKQDEIQNDVPGITKKKFLYNLSRSDFEKHWGKDYQGPSFGDKCLALLYEILPKFGPLKVLQFKTPTPETEKMFEQSFNATLDRFRGLLKQVDSGTPDVPNDNFDTGSVTGPGKYKLNDETRAKLLDKLAEQKFAGTPQVLRDDLLAFFSDPNAHYAIRKDSKEWARLQSQLTALRNTPAAPAVASAGH